MIGASFPRVLFLLAVIVPALPVSAQYLQVIGQDPRWGPICTGPKGPGPCAQVRAYMASQGMLPGTSSPQPAVPPLIQIGVDPVAGPICAGPLGPGPCAAVAQYLQRNLGQRPAIERRPVPNVVQIGNHPTFGPICLGPLGPGPCNAVRAYLARLAAPSPSVVGDLSSVTVTSSNERLGAICSGPTGQQPCSLLQQDIVDSGRPPTIDQLPNAQNLPVEELARECAQRAGLDVTNFAACTGREMILTERQKEIVDCASNTNNKLEFGSCAAKSMGFQLNTRQQKLVDCGRESGGDLEEFQSCAGGAFLGSRATSTLKCYRDAHGDRESFATCAAGKLLGDALTTDQREALGCVAEAQDASDLAQCAAGQAGLSADQQTVVQCAIQSEGGASDFMQCAGTDVVEKYIGRDASAALKCGMNSSDGQGFATCAAADILGQHATPEQKIAVRCAAESGGDIQQMGVCAGANMLNMKLDLNPEQQIAVQCLVSTGGQPYAAAGCIATRLTARELTKCFTDGIGGRGCFGDNNDLFGKNGWTAQRLKDLAGGPHSVINDPDQIWGGNNSFVRNPSQIWGGNNSFVRNPSQIWGGPNSVFNNPGQLAPQPLQLGKIGNTRICVPWC